MVTLDEYQAVTSRLRGLKRGGNNGHWKAHCPAHEDNHESLTLRIGDSGALVIRCHAGEGCSFAAIRDALNLKDTDFFPPKDEAMDEKRKIVETYPYCDEKGKLLYQAVRFEPKGFAYRRPTGQAGKWEWSLGDVRRAPYNLPAIVKAAGKRKVLICEGEKDVNTLTKLKLLATCNVGGAGKWPADGNEAFAGCHVCILGDNDEAGLKHVYDVAEKLKSVVAEIVIVERLPDVPEKEDVTWWMEHGGTRDKLVALIGATPAWWSKPDSKPSERGMADILADVEKLPPVERVLVARAALAGIEKHIEAYE